MNDERLLRELQIICKRIYNLECQLKTLDYEQHEESNSKIDYIAMMTDVEIEVEEDDNQLE